MISKGRPVGTHYQHNREQLIINSWVYDHPSNEENDYEHCCVKAVFGVVELFQYV